MERNPVLVKLGSKHGFYNEDVKKEYTEIQIGKMPYIVLNILNKDEITRRIGLIESGINRYLLDEMPELAVNEYGESTSLPNLLKDFKKGNIIKYNRSNIILTELGKQFLKNNVIE